MRPQPQSERPRIVNGHITGNPIDTAHQCPNCEHWWHDHIGPVINWTRMCHHHVDAPTTDGHSCMCSVSIHDYPQVLWDQPRQGMSLACKDIGCIAMPPCIGECVVRSGRDHDPVNHPSHYTSHPSGVECIQIAEHYNYCLGNVIKYVWRAGLKEGADELEDLEKAKFYLEREVDRRKQQLRQVRQGSRPEHPSDRL